MVQNYKRCSRSSNSDLDLNMMDFQDIIKSDLDQAYEAEDSDSGPRFISGSQIHHESNTSPTHLHLMPNPYSFFFFFGFDK